MTFKSKKKLSVSQDVLSQEVNGEIVLLDLCSESYFGLDEVGSRVWTMLQSGRNVPDIIETLLKEFDVDEDVLIPDLNELINSLMKAGLISADE